ncbi:MAG: hypothetical protein WB579_11800 [Bryobacteraceae bacterium]
MKDEILDNLRTLKVGLTKVYATVKRANTQLVNPAAVSNPVASLCRLWSEKLEPDLSRRPIVDGDCLRKYRSGLERLFGLASKRNKATSHLSACDDLLQSFDTDLIKPVLFAPSEAPIDPRLQELISNVPYPDQKGYLDEALRCIKADCKRAAAVLGWSAAMHQLHCKIEELGLDTFQAKSAELASQKKGRFKGFDGTGPIQSISDLRETADRKVLIVLDGMDLIEGNQRRRLEHCLDIRIQCSHPGDAPMTPENLLSFFSDLSEIVFNNGKLAI